MTTNSPFAVLNQTTLTSFNEQKNLIKRVFKGKPVQCAHCQQTLKVILPEHAKANEKAGIFCPKGCTDIELDMEAVAGL